MSGCGIIPKSVELFQKKVKPVPVKTEKAAELERQAIDFIDQKVEKAYIAGIKENVSTNVIQPLRDAHIVAPSLLTSLGPPATPWKSTSTNLALSLDKSTAALNSKLEDYRDKNEKLEGKKIEGTGIVQMPWLVYIAILVILFYIIKFALSIYGSINPVVGLGFRVAKVPVDLLKRGFSEIIEAGETFKDSIEDKIEDPVVKNEVIDLFRQAHLAKQSRDTQDVIQTITRK